MDLCGHGTLETAPDSHLADFRIPVAASLCLCPAFALWVLEFRASATACLACVSTWLEDFRSDMTHIDVPTLVIHGDTDRILPINATGLRTAKLIKECRFVVVQEGPHCIPWTHAEEVNRELVDFLGETKTWNY